MAEKDAGFPEIGVIINRCEGAGNSGPMEELSSELPLQSRCYVISNSCVFFPEFVICSLFIMEYNLYEHMYLHIHTSTCMYASSLLDWNM